MTIEQKIWRTNIRIIRFFPSKKPVLWNRNYFLRFRFRLLKSNGSGSDFWKSYGSGTGSDFLTSYGSGSTRQKVTVPTVPIPVRFHNTVKNKTKIKALTYQPQ
jgi:hypothetical protein